MIHRETMINSLDNNAAPTTNNVAAILVTPLASFACNNKQSGLWYLKLVASLHSNKSQILNAVSQRYQDRVLNPLQHVLEASGADLSAKQLSLRLSFATSTLLQSACDWSLDEAELNLQATQLITFIAAGLSAK